MTLDEAWGRLQSAYDEADAIGKQVKEMKEKLADLVERKRAAEVAIDAAQDVFESLAYAGFGSVGHRLRPPSIQS